jgi:pSer/pThr/pTyr-binding forkhead associated (FHA) protein
VPTTLVVTEGPLTGTSLPLRGGGILIGRNPECALVLDDDYASGRHCRIHPDPSGRDGWVVEDLGSTNGTFIGRDRLTGSRPVEVGTTLRIGKTVLELRG